MVYDQELYQRNTEVYQRIIKGRYVRKNIKDKQETFLKKFKDKQKDLHQRRMRNDKGSDTKGMKSWLEYK